MKILLCVVGFSIAANKRESNMASGPQTMNQLTNGDIVIGGLISIHTGKNCEEITEYGVQVVEVINMITEQINQKNNSILPGIKIGTFILDTCASDVIALDRVVKSILPLLSSPAEDICDSERNVTSHTSSSLFAGIIGAVYSSVSLQISKVMQPYHVPTVSFWSTSSDLSDKTKYPNFFRTMPPDLHQAKAIMGVVQKMHWNFICVIYEDDHYGNEGFKELRKLAEERDICFSDTYEMSSETSDSEFRNVVNQILNNRAKVVVVFTHTEIIEKLIRASGTFSAAKSLVWIGTDSWAGQEFKITNNSILDIANGAIAFQPKSSPLRDFEEYFTSRTIFQRKQDSLVNPWFGEYLAKYNNCSINLSDENSYKRPCRDNEQLIRDNYPNVYVLEHAANAFLSLVHSLNKYHREVCKGKPGMCAEMKEGGKSGLASQVLKNMKNITFQGSTGEIFEFDERQEGKPDYNILIYYRKKRGWITSGVYKDGKIEWTAPDLLEKARSTESNCSKPCERGHMKNFDSQVCCWHCTPCKREQFVFNSTCWDCPPGMKPNDNQTVCEPLQIQYLTIKTFHGFVPLVIGIIGNLFTVLVIGIYIRNRDTAIVKASGKELCFFVLGGCLVTFSNSIPLAADDNLVSCTFFRISFAIGPTCMYAGLLTKTLRVIIIFRSKTALSARVRPFLRPKPQIAATACIVLPQVIVLLIWFLLYEPRPIVIYPTPDIAFVCCSNAIDYRVLIGLVYPGILAVVCTVLATINRNVPTGFNETIFIVFAMYCTCLTWLAFLPIFFTNYTNIPLKLMTVSVSLSVSAFTVLCCAFAPRCYILLFRPDRNTAQSVMSRPRFSSILKSEEQRTNQAGGEITNAVKFTGRDDTKIRRNMFYSEKRGVANQGYLNEEKIISANKLRRWSN